MTHRSPSAEFNRIHDQYLPLVRAIVSRTLRRPDEVDDCVQGIMIEAWTMIQAGEHLEKGWFTLRAQSRAIDRRKQLARDPESLDTLVAAEADSNDPGLDHLLALGDCSPSLDRSLILALRSGIDRLPARTAEVMNLFYYGALSIPEIAIRLHLAAGTVKWHLAVGRDSLRLLFVHSTQEVA